MTLVKAKRRKRIRLGIRKKISGTGQIPRLSVFRSNKALYVQIIDDGTGATLVAASTAELGDTVKPNMESSKKLGEKVAEKALAAGIKKIVFDRGGYLFHGRVKALADSAREKGLEF
jgi:large subunit ribosomal protein L18